MWRIKENEEDENICMAAAGFIFLASQVPKEKKNKRRSWVRLTLSKRKVYDSDELVIDLRNDDIGLSGEPRSSVKNSFRMSSEDFENFKYLVHEGGLFLRSALF
jgi:hypothetical protein